MLTFAAVGGVVGMPERAQAQTPSPLGEWQYSVGIPLQKMWEPQLPTWQVRVGAAATFGPRYDGAERYRPLGGINVDVRYKDLFFVSTGEGAGVNFAQGPNWRASLAVVYDLGRRSHDDPQHLDGLVNINAAPAIKLSGDYVISKDFPLVLRADVKRSLGGSNGWVGDLGAYMPLPGSSDKFFWFAGPSVTLADSTYMNSWFGVNRSAPGASKYPDYHASAGFKSINFGVSLIWAFRKHWFATADGGVEQLVGNAARSPIVQRSTNGVADVSINYQF
ncbi:MipA/OmpV family protein [Paraburkholderia sp.]|uniref:MipA/OmpV family protein n=1 Tax=Paraburkholderia sp. TaxID=1926495 RepID=UPI003438DA4A